MPSDLRGLTELNLNFNRFTRFSPPTNLTQLSVLHLRANLLTNFNLPAQLSALTFLDLSTNQLTTFTVPAGLSNLFGLFLTGNQLANITLPPDMARLGSLGFLGNPLTTFVLPAPLAATNLAQAVTDMKNQGVSVFTYPLTVHLIPRRQQPPGAFRFAITGPPGDYTVMASSNLVTWAVVGAVSNPLGSVVFTDVTAHLFFEEVLPCALPALTNRPFVSLAPA